MGVAARVPMHISGREQQRLEHAREQGLPWRHWGPYLSERQWGTVREDYSQNGDAWGYFGHDQARSRAYRWGEDGLAGISDDQQRLCFAIALWNERDPILKERLFGLTNAEGNHGEDAKEYYFYLDSTPTHSYMKWLYKYPHKEYPYLDLVETSRKRSRQEFEYELLDTGVFEGGNYFDVFAEYAKVAPEDVLVRLTVYNRGSGPAKIHLLPTLWFRNTWRFFPDTERPELSRVEGPRGTQIVSALHPGLGERFLYIDGDDPLLFTENETNNQRLFGGTNSTRYVKDGINDYVVHGRREAASTEGRGTKVSAHRVRELKGGEALEFRLRLTDRPPGAIDSPFASFASTFDQRRHEADEFYAQAIPASVTGEDAAIARQALAGMLWTKQFYYYDLEKWLGEHGIQPFVGNGNGSVRNRAWGHMVNADVISMPDKWEYPWYAAWDLAFHTVAFSALDVDFAKGQLDLMLRENYTHPNAQIPAYEWNFGDVNPPVHAWATAFVYHLETALHGRSDIAFLKRSFGKLLANFTWWVNRKDRDGKNVFEGGFLGLDNIGVFDRSAPLPTGGCLEQADGTAWMAFFCQCMLQIAVEIAAEDPAFEDLSARFIDHFLLIANAMNRMGDGGMWDEEDGFYYDVLSLPDGQSTRLKVRSMVGLLPLCATTVVEPWQRERVPRLLKYVEQRLRHSPELMRGIHTTGEGNRGCCDRGILALVNEQRLRRILARMLDEQEFLSPHGIRSLSRYHAEHPYVFNVRGQDYRVSYLPAESDSGMFGGNSNWRGPVWFPVNVLLIRALLQFYAYYGDTFKIRCPTRTGPLMNLYEVAEEIGRRMIAIWKRGSDGRRPVFGGQEPFQTDPHWRDLMLFYEYFHGDNGAGLGASHQTGWTGLVATLIQYFGAIDARHFLERGPSRSLRPAEHPLMTGSY
jgi:hypothetical protein